VVIVAAVYQSLPPTQTRRVAGKLAGGANHR
jgi:hypothetical protein